MLTISANGARLAGANYRHGLWVWDLASGEIVWRLGGKDLEIDAIALSKSGDCVAALTPTGCTEYELSSGSEYEHHELPAGAAIAYGNTNDLQICASILGLVQLWKAGDLASGQTLSAAPSGISAALFSSSAQSILLQPTENEHIEILDRSGSLVQRLTHPNPTAASLNDDGELVALASREGISLWRDNQQTNSLSRELVTHLNLSPDGAQLAFLDESYGIHIVDTAKLATHYPTNPSFPPEDVTVDATGASVLLATRGGGLYYWDSATGSGHRLPYSINHPRAILVTEDGTSVISRIAEAKIGAISLAKPELQEVYGSVHGEPELLCFNQSGNIWSYVDNNLIYVHTRGEKKPEQIPSPGAHQVENLELSPAGDTLAIAWLGGVIGIRDARGAKASSLRLLRQSGPAIHAFSFSPDGDSLAIADVTGHVEVWGLYQFEQLWSKQMGSVSSIAWSADASLLAAGEYHGDIVIFKDGHILTTWHSEAGETLALCFDRPAKHLYSGHKNTTVLKWVLP
jgi:WD40 repeat protein